MQKELQESLLLAVEGSGKSVSVALIDNQSLITSFYINSGVQSTQLLLHLIDQSFQLTKYKKSDLDGICLSTGPGSFTSLRVSVASCMGISDMLQIPIYCTSSLKTKAMSIGKIAGRFHVIDNAYKGEFYIASYFSEKERIKETLPPTLFKPDEVLNHLQDGDAILGNASDGFLEKFQLELEAKKVALFSDYSQLPYGYFVAMACMDQPAKDYDEGFVIDPTYLRPSDAEIKRNKK